jgi:hypothetical protein
MASSRSRDEFAYRQFSSGEADRLSFNWDVFGFRAAPITLAAAFDRDEVAFAEAIMDPHSFGVHLKLLILATRNSVKKRFDPGFKRS